VLPECRTRHVEKFGSHPLTRVDFSAHFLGNCKLGEPFELIQDIVTGGSLIEEDINSKPA
jgi:hypothetical protein